MSTLLLIDLAIVALINLVLWLYILLKPVTVRYVESLHLGGLALALPGVIFMTPRVAGNEQVLRHELAHIQQLKRYTPIGVALMLGWHYGSGYISHFLKHRSLPAFASLWETNPLEIEANAKMGLDTPLPNIKGWPRR
ncbi:MAG: hypothetical protein ABGY95_00310 [Rubritalea sp.]|uniref:hypothetical protein n=1 Tax=Rubritalea sp. TaxID=2109375 RepID=UPI0032421033